MLGRLEQLRKAVIAGLATAGFERTRRTLALLALAFFVVVYALVALSVPAEWRAAFAGLSLCYVTAFLGLGSEWFWGRWFASGLGWSGTMVGIYGIVTIGWQPVLGLYAGLHGLVVLMLRGDRIAALYDGRPEWRERFGLDEHGAARLGKTITRASASLPALVIWAFGPKQPQGLSVVTSIATGVVSVALPLLVVAGLWLLLRRRSAGLLVLLAGGVLGFWTTYLLKGMSPTATGLHVLGGRLGFTAPVAIGAIGSMFLLAAFWPFAGSVLRHFRGR